MGRRQMIREEVEAKKQNKQGVAQLPVCRCPGVLNGLRKAGTVGELKRSLRLQGTGDLLQGCNGKHHVVG